MKGKIAAVSEKAAAFVEKHVIPDNGKPVNQTRKKFLFHPDTWHVRIYVLRHEAHRGVQNLTFV